MINSIVLNSILLLNIVSLVMIVLIYNKITKNEKENFISDDASKGLIYGLLIPGIIIIIFFLIVFGFYKSI